MMQIQDMGYGAWGMEVRMIEEFGSRNAEGGN